ncbi:phospholipid-transporting ATPase VA isoform X2 [Neocloeon triangulifer]|uniref:phospholipid-transporting ATPase VA isoform X2 n=1 Tax=Neocloeon triangulifer TaxID=2078957 RepID=UPI00286F8C79|nr:phospholipid-transporting ATPase VA isoform X2 [Neocloeon triangulifer]
MPGSADHQAPDAERCYMFPDTRTAALRGHTRSASHGAAAMPSGLQARTSTSPHEDMGSTGSITSRPSALKKGHQRAFSHGQIGTNEPGSVGLSRGHNRVGSRTEFILPPGHRDEPPPPRPRADSVHFKPGHSRQASRSESIYTLRNQPPPKWTDKLFFWRRRPEDEATRKVRVVVPNHTVPEGTPPKQHPNHVFPGNEVRTTKYTMLSFLPKNLFEQFHRVANLYFLFIVLLNWFPAINAFGKEIAMIPVAFVLGVTAIKDAFEDRRRHNSDKRINNSTCRVYNSAQERYVKTLWKNLRAGDLVHLSNNELIPADVLLLRSSEEHGVCYIDTCNLDGETNLKQRSVVRGFETKQDAFEASQFRSHIEVDPPTTKIYRFHGTVVHESGERVPIGTDNLLLRECVLKNTDFVEGIVVYAGHETKAMLNNGGPRYKRSQLERAMNRDVVWCVVILVVLCIIGAIGCRFWLSSVTSSTYWPLFITEYFSPAYEAVLTFWTYVIILQVMIPLSLYVTIEMTKILQVYHIHNDPYLYDAERKKRVECRALNITEELGQVQYIFSDKTGTLTENKMIFRRCTIDGIDYNHPPIAELQNLRPGVTTPIHPNMRLQEEIQALERGMRLSIDSAHTTRTLKSTHEQRVQEFFVLLALCNTVVVAKHPHHDSMNASGVIESPSVINIEVQSQVSSLSHSKTNSVVDKYSRLNESRSVTPSPTSTIRPRILDLTGQSSLSPICSSSESTPLGTPSPKPVKRLTNFLRVGRSNKHNHSPAVTPSPSGEKKPIYEAESPDELALVDAAYTYNCRLLKRVGNTALISVPGEGIVEYEVVQILPFDSSRKSMSVVVRHPVSKQLTLYTKGADSTILCQLAPSDDPAMQQFIFNTQQHLNSYARQGLRVLVMAKRNLTDAEFEAWLIQHKDAEMMHDRERRVRESFCRLETNLILLGATGIEDRLQDGVPETIAALLEAGIVIWVLTGDKQETAINIAYSAKLFSPQMELLKISARSRDAAESTITAYLEDIERELPRGSGPSSNPYASIDDLPPHFPKRALVVDGKTLTYILDQRSNLKKPFLTLTRFCSSVLCCRATPLQKAYIVKVVKEVLKMRTLAIGDGANDVSMIQTADIGVGISGQEGMQAVMASDFALSRFKYLERFLLVHGHWCYDRLARMVLYFLYKNATFVFLIFWYQLYCGFSGTVMMDQMYLMLYNLVFTSLPPIAIGVYDQDAPAELLLSKPRLYKQGRLGSVYKPASFWLTMADSIYQSLIMFFLTLFAYQDTTVGIWEFGTAITSTCMFVNLLHVAVEIKSWTIIHILAMAASIGGFYTFAFIYNSFCVNCFGLPSTYWVVHQTLGNSVYWFSTILASVLALLPRFVIKVLKTCMAPNDVTKALVEHRNIRRDRTNLDKRL